MDHRLVSLKFLRSTALIPVKVRPRQKDPFPEWDPRRVAQEDHALTLMEIERNKELNLGALFSGKYVDIDDDAQNPFLRLALDYFLPETPYVWGRKSKPRGHRVYALHEDFERGPYGPIMRYIKSLRGPDDSKKEIIGAIDEFSYSVEIRGGKPENGLFSVLPGSINPSGEAVEWDKDIDPTVGGAFVEIAQLVRALRLSVVAAMIVPRWTEGQRNDISLALAGTLWRVRTSTMAAYGLEAEEDAPEGVFVLDYQDAEALLTAIMHLSGDDPNDRRSRLINLKNTWRKLDGEAGSKVTGGKVLADLIGPEIGGRVVKALYRLLSDNDAAEQLEALAERYLMWYGPGVIVDLDMVKNSRDSPWMTQAQATASLGGKNLIIGDKKIPVSKMLFNSAIITRITGLTFDPSTPDLVVNGGYGLKINQWRGFAVQPCEQQVKNDEIKMFYDYVKEIIANGDDDAAHWVFSWLADLLTFPHKKPGTALVLVGVEGAGKTFLGEHVLGRIIGPIHSTQTNSVTTLTHNFNTIIDNKIFLVCNEAIHSYQRDVAARLKSIITDESIIIEPKGINSYTKPNHMRFMFTSNEEQAAIFISPSPYERRFTVLKVSSDKANNRRYWGDMHLWTPQALPKIMRWLMDYRYDRHLIMRPFETQAKRDIQRVGVDTEVSWILNRMNSGFPVSLAHHHYWFEAYKSDNLTEEVKKANRLLRDEWPDLIMTSVLEEDYRSYVRSQGKTVHSGSLLTTLRRVLPPNSLAMVGQHSLRYVDQRTGQIIQGRHRFYTFPTIEAIIEHLRKKYGEIIDELMEQDMPIKEEPSVGVLAGPRGEF